MSFVSRNSQGPDDNEYEEMIVDLTQENDCDIDDEDNSDLVDRIHGNNKEIDEDSDDERRNPNGLNEDNDSITSDGTNNYFIVGSDASFDDLFPKCPTTDRTESLKSSLETPNGTSLEITNISVVEPIASTSFDSFVSKLKDSNKRCSTASINSVLTKGKRGNKKAATTKTLTKKLKLSVEKTQLTKDVGLSNMYKPKECMKHVYVEVHPSLLEQWHCTEVGHTLRSAGVHISLLPEVCDPGLLMWTRKGEQLQSDVCIERCQRSLVIMTADEVVPIVSNGQLSQHLTLLSEMVGCVITLVVFGIKDYFKSTRGKEKTDTHITKLKFEMSCADVLVSTSCDVTEVNSPDELASFILIHTKAFAEAPYKKAKRAVDNQAQFYMKGDNKKCVAVDNNGNGLGRLWQQMLGVLAQSSLEVARALVTPYPSPLALYESLQSPNGVAALAEVGVSRDRAPGARVRRVGGEFARRLHILMTVEEGGTLVE